MSYDLDDEKCGALRGMENWQPTCDLPAGHPGAHRWQGPSLNERIRAIEDADAAERAKAEGRS